MSNPGQALGLAKELKALELERDGKEDAFYACCAAQVDGITLSSAAAAWDQAFTAVEAKKAQIRLASPASKFEARPSPTRQLSYFDPPELQVSVASPVASPGRAEESVPRRQAVRQVKTDENDEPESTPCRLC